MKYFIRILAFLFISFSSCFSSDYDSYLASFNRQKESSNDFFPLKNILLFHIDSFSYDFNANGVKYPYSIDGKSVIEIPSNFGPYFKNPATGKPFYINKRNFYSDLDKLYYTLSGPNKDILDVFFVEDQNLLSSHTIYFYEMNLPSGSELSKYNVSSNPSSIKNIIDTYTYYGPSSLINVTSYSRFVKYIDSVSINSACSSGFIYNGYFCVLENFGVPCIEQNNVFSEKLGKCIPICPEGAYYNSFSDECTTSCDNVSNRDERFDCLCKEKGLGGVKRHEVSQSLVVINTPSGGDGYIDYKGTIYCEGGNLGPTDVSDYLNNKGYDGKNLREATSDFFSTNDVTNVNNTSHSGSSEGTGQSGSSEGTSSGDSGGSGGGDSGGSSGGGEQGNTDPAQEQQTPEQQQKEKDYNECKAIANNISSEFHAYLENYVYNGIDCSNDEAVRLASGAKTTLETKLNAYNSGKCVSAYMRLIIEVPAYSCKTEPTKPDPVEPPAPQNPSDKISFDETTNTVTITDQSGKTQVVTPTETTKNNQGQWQTLKYTDPDTGKIVEFKAKEDGTWERVETQNSGTGDGSNPSDKEPGSSTSDGKPGGSSEGEGAGTSEEGNKEGEKEGEKEGDGEFNGGELGALGNANDFDTNGELSGLIGSIDELAAENQSFLSGIIDNVTTYIDDLKNSIDSLTEKVTSLGSNPFSSSNITSCATNFTLLEQTIQIDICEQTSKLKNLFYTVFYLALNSFIAFAMFKLFVLILVSI